MPEATNDLAALREELFATMRGVKAGTIDLDRARQVNDIGKTLVDTARVEVDFLRATGEKESAFLAAKADHDIGTLPPSAEWPKGITGRTVHRLVG